MKRRSAASSTQPDPPTIFVDRSVGSLTAQVIREHGIPIIRHDDLFPQETADEIWLQRAGAAGWIVLSRDARIRYSPLAKSVCASAGVALFLLTGGNLTGEAEAAVVARALPRLLRLAARTRPPYIANVRSSGEIVLMEDGPKNQRGG